MPAGWIEQERQAIEAAIDGYLPRETEPPSTLHRAMRYSVFAGGKRLRPLICRAAARAITGSDVLDSMLPACALELLHTYSLIHDDLPALDNDDLRRGRPTCHKAFGEAVAILAGDALLTFAFGLIGRAPTADMSRGLLREFASAAGTPAGMVAGQIADLEAEGQPPTPDVVSFIHRYKTAALIRASAVSGAIAARARPEEIIAMRRFGEEIGLAFQIVDDILDVTGDVAALGKTTGKDVIHRKATYPAVFGLERSRETANELAGAALQRLAIFETRAAYLRELVPLMVERAT